MAKVDLFPDFRDFLKLLNATGVRYLMLGGYAVIYYGYERSTADMDIWIAADRENAKKVSEVLQEFAGFAPKDVPPALFEKLGNMIQFGIEPARIDVLNRPSGVTGSKSL